MARRTKSKYRISKNYVFNADAISKIEEIAKGTGVPADIIAGIFVNESGGRNRALAMNPRFIYGKSSSGRDSKTRSPQKWLMKKLVGTVAEQYGSAGKSAHGKTAQKVFKEIYRHSPYWAVFCGAFGFLQVLGSRGMKRYGKGSDGARKFYEAFQSDPYRVGVNAAIDWWKSNPAAKQLALNRDYRGVTIKYLGGLGTGAYEATMRRAADIYRRQTGMQGGEVATSPARRIALIGDSNAATMTPLYASHFSGDKVYKAKPASGAGTEWFLFLLRAVQAKDASKAPPKRGGKKIAKDLINFKPDIIHITAMGGNDTEKTTSKSGLKEIEKNAKALFTIIKTYKGTVHGPPKNRPGSASTNPKSVFHKSKGNNASERYTAARQKVAEVLQKAAADVGISFFNPFGGQIPDMTRKGSYKGDGIHMAAGAARAHFNAAKAMLGGATSGAGGVSYSSGVDAASGGASTGTGSGTSAEDEHAIAMSAEEREARAKERREREEIRKKYRQAFDSAITAGLESGKESYEDLKNVFQTQTNLGKVAIASYKHKDDPGKIFDTAFKNQNAPPAEKLGQNVEDPDKEIESQSADGRILKKYIAVLNKHQPDFNFEDFYSEVNTYIAKGFGMDAIEDLFPKSGRDYVFGDEHWRVFVLIRDLKDKISAQNVSESYRFLGNLVREIKQKW